MEEFDIALEVGRDEFFFRVAEDTLHRAVGSGFQSSVDGISRRGLIDENGQVDDADVGRRHAHGVAVKLALQFGNDEVQGFGSTGGTGIMLRAAARARRRSLCGRSSSFWSFV